MRILAFAYACEPAEGSEPGAGWVFARMLGGLGETWVITRANNRARIEERLGSIPERDRLRFIYVDLPPWARFWKRGRIGVQPYYLIWQLLALRAARRLERDVGFDLVWHVTLANAWIGSLAGFVGPPFVYGPVGGTMTAPLRMARVLGVRGTAYEAFRGAVRWGARYANPLARSAWRRARVILAQNRETMAWFPARYRGKATVFPNAVVDLRPVPRTPRQAAALTALFAGRLMPLKGVALAIAALRHLPEWRLLVCGEGSDERRLRRLAARLGVADRVGFLGHLPRERVLELLVESDVFVFPSLRDDAGWAVAEALACGLPVACLERGGPAQLVGSGVPISEPEQTARDLADRIRVLGDRPPAPSQRGRDVASMRKALQRLIDPLVGTNASTEPFSLEIAARRNVS